MASRPPGWGEPAPWFFAPAPVNPRFAFSSLGGRFVALTFFERSDAALSRAFLAAVAAGDPPRDDSSIVSYGVSRDAADLGPGLATRAFPPNRVFHDPNLEIAASYGLALTEGGGGNADRAIQPRWFLLDPMLRVYASGGLDRPDEFLAAMRSLPAPETHAAGIGQPWAPVLMVPRVLEPAFCRRLIEIYELGQPKESGFMRTEGGKTVGRSDPSFKRRADVQIEDEAVKGHLRDALRFRLAPEIAKVFQFTVTRIERYIVACYDGQTQGFFRPHRDNTTAGTAHRRFAVTLNLNAEEYQGGELRFPEFGARTYKPPTGGAVVFSCSLLHEATPVTNGRRYATLPFLYDEAAARIREENLALLQTDGAG